MKTEQEQIEQIEKVLKDSAADYKHLKKKGVCYCYAENLVAYGYGDVTEYKAEIEQLKNANSELTDNLVFYKVKSYKLESRIDALKIEIKHKQEVKQAQTDVLNELKNKTHNYYPSIDSYCTSQHVVLVRDIDELIKEIEDANSK